MKCAIGSTGRWGRSSRILLPALFQALLVLLAPEARSRDAALHLSLEDAVTPVTSRYIVEAIETAERDQERVVVLQIDTPGGLDTAMREAVKAILGSRVPVVTWVGPSGARAASAGLFIVLAGNVAAMAPGTNLGAAHPVGLGGASPDSVMASKMVNDAVAYVRSIAGRRGKNADWAERAVRASVSAEAEEALRLGVIDRISTDLEELLGGVDGTVVTTADGAETLHTAGVPIREYRMGFADRVLSVLTNPNIAYLLFLAGILGIFFELSSPGAILPGIIGGISMILALFAFQTLPVNFAGVLLILLSVILFIAEVKVASSGALAIGGVLSLLLGSLMLFRRRETSMSLSWEVIVPAVLITAGFFLFAVAKGLKAQRARARTGMEGMVGAIATVLEDLSPDGKVFLHGEIWNATASRSVVRGLPVRVLSVEGLHLRVEPIEGGRAAREG